MFTDLTLLTSNYFCNVTYRLAYPVLFKLNIFFSDECLLLLLCLIYVGYNIKYKTFECLWTFFGRGGVKTYQGAVQLVILDEQNVHLK